MDWMPLSFVGELSWASGTVFAMKREMNLILRFFYKDGINVSPAME